MTSKDYREFTVTSFWLPSIEIVRHLLDLAVNLAVRFSSILCHLIKHGELISWTLLSKDHEVNVVIVHSHCAILDLTFSLLREVCILYH